MQALVNARSREEWADEINADWRKGVESILSVSQKLIDSHDELGPSEFRLMCETNLDFGYKTALKLEKLAQDDRIGARGHLLPPNWRTLYELHHLTDDQWDHGFETGIINPEMERSDAVKLRRPELAPVPPLDVADGEYSVILADPPWRYEHVKTESRAIENQYPTKPLDEICGLAVPCAEDCVLFMWATSPKLAEALEVVNAWDFTYRTCAVWVKDKIGMGYYFRQRHELLLVGTRGAIRAPEPEVRFDSVIEAPRLEHSAKPPIVHELIESMYPDHRKIELYARVSRDGWDVWGNEV